MSSANKLAYEKPSIEFWSAEALDSIEATMSGGGGGGGSTCYYVVVLNNPSFGFGYAGHAAILFFSSKYPQCSLFNFAPKDNKSDNTKGAVASELNNDDCTSFNVFRNACKKRHSNSSRGIAITNGYKTWIEGFSRYILLATTDNSKYVSMINRANAIAKKPPIFKSLKYNCQVFVNEVLSSGGITLQTDAYVSLANAVIPNEVFEFARHANGVRVFEKQGSM